MQRASHAGREMCLYTGQKASILWRDSVADPILCSACNKDLGDHTARRAFICISTQGDERVLSWWRCEHCGVYTNEEYVDRFMGDEYSRIYGPFPAEAGDEVVARIAKCPANNDKWCECEVHKHFGSD